MRKHPIYEVWANMKKRCSNQNHPLYKWYGGRGITFCTEWSSFLGFYNDMWMSYRKGLELDRINNDGPYCKENCRWVTHKENIKNRRPRKPAILITAFDTTKSIKDWSLDRRCCVSCKRLRDRIRRYGWQPEKAITTPLK